MPLTIPPGPYLPRRTFLRQAACAAAVTGTTSCRIFRSRTPVRIGILHSLSGTMAASESPLRDAEIMAVEEINRDGGVLGGKVEAIVQDASSDPARFALKAEELLTQQRVCSVFGGWTSISRKAMLPVFEHYNGLLWYPLQYEGNECSRNIFYGGAAPNQQIQPAVSWLLGRNLRRFFMAGSDYIFPRTANRGIRVQLDQQDGQVVGEEYVPLVSSDFEPMVAAIRKASPDVIFSTINGSGNLHFFRALRKQGITASHIPVMLVSVAEAEARNIGAELIAGNYACWNYFQSIDTQENRTFVARFRKRFGPYRVTDDPIETAYSQVHLWAAAVNKAGSLEPDAIRRAAPGLQFASPGGLIRIDERNHHTWKPVYVGQINDNAQFDIRYSSPGLVGPVPFPDKVCDLT